MKLEPQLIHPAVLAAVGDPSRLATSDLPPAERVYADTLGGGGSAKARRREGELYLCIRA